MSVDPRNLSATQVGTKLRDASVDPKDTDFLGPTNAGAANPHGETVVNPGIRDVNNPIPGPVGASLAEQETKAYDALAKRIPSAKTTA